ncbi:ABC transporter substrate-binding protein [Oceanospirillum sp.]|uniref:ABC transporter substrate-binding protein n=1 Tax=Oceanospirillum sp. TaxID=2021254 RepID=UPI003A95215A
MPLINNIYRIQVLFLNTCRSLTYCLILLSLPISSLASALELTPADRTNSADIPAQEHHHNTYRIVVLVNKTENPFWSQVKTSAKKAAHDLNLELQVIAINNNPLRPVRVLSALVNSSHKPNAVLFPNIKNTGKAILELLEQHQVYSIVYDNGFAPKDNIGLPGQFYRYWVGQIDAGNYEASRQLTQELLNQALTMFPEQRPLPIIVLEGRTASRANAQRLLGMFDALMTYSKQVEIRQIFRTRYDTRHARHAILTAHRRYPGVRVIWAANDAMALSAAEAVKETGLIPGKDILIAGFDLLPEAQAKIKTGELFNSYGGHALSAAWGLVYLHDILHDSSHKYRRLAIPLQSGRHPFKVPQPGPGGTLWVKPDADFSNIDFSALSLTSDQSQQSDQKNRYLFEQRHMP